jgi:NIPSNAP protein
MTLKTVLLVAAAMAASITIPQAGAQERAQEHGRVFELRTYTCYEGKLPDLLARFRNHTMSIFEKHGITNIAYWVPQDSTAHENTLIYVIAHPSREAAKKNWAAFGADPEWQKVQKDSEANGKIVSKVESVYMDPTDFSPVR